jgi:hypothetical protein
MLWRAIDFSRLGLGTKFLCTDKAIDIAVFDDGENSVKAQQKFPASIPRMIETSHIGTPVDGEAKNWDQSLFRLMLIA